LTFIFSLFAVPTPQQRKTRAAHFYSPPKFEDDVDGKTERGEGGAVLGQTEVIQDAQLRFLGEAEGPSLDPPCIYQALLGKAG
jgi:hypothetical protein